MSKLIAKLSRKLFTRNSRPQDILYQRTSRKLRNRTFQTCKAHEKLTWCVGSKVGNMALAFWHLGTSEVDSHPSGSLFLKCARRNIGHRLTPANSHSHQETFQSTDDQTSIAHLLTSTKITTSKLLHSTYICINGSKCCHTSQTPPHPTRASAAIPLIPTNPACGPVPTPPAHPPPGAAPPPCRCWSWRLLRASHVVVTSSARHT